MKKTAVTLMPRLSFLLLRFFPPFPQQEFFILPKCGPLVIGEALLISAGIIGRVYL